MPTMQSHAPCLIIQINSPSASCHFYIANCVVMGCMFLYIRFWDNVLPAIVQRGESLTVRYDPRNLFRIYVIGSDQRYHPVPYADLSLSPISLWEQRAPVACLRGAGDNAPAQVAIFQAVVA